MRECPDDSPMMQKLWNDAMETLSPDGLSGEELDHMVHTLVARRLVERLQRPDCTAGDLQVGCRFLKDNDITSLPVPGSAHEALKEKMRERLPFKITGTD